MSQASESNEVRLLKNHVSSLECELQRLRASATTGHLEESQAVRDRDAAIHRLEAANEALDDLISRDVRGRRAKNVIKSKELKNAVRRARNTCQFSRSDRLPSRVAVDWTQRLLDARNHDL